eukprot:c17147_g2_i1 orf=361-1593(+)
MSARQCRVWKVYWVVIFMQLMYVTTEAQYLAAEDVAALKAVQSWLRDALDSAGENSGAFFSTWDFNNDPCSFEGVLCDVVEGQERVAALNLGIASGSSAGLHGRLHPALGSLSALVQLTLAPGRVGGSIPSTLAQLSNLQNLGLSHNLLTGSIPSGLARLSRLVSLDLAFNRLSGSFPSDLAAVPSLMTLRLAHNRLTGTLPPSFTASASLDHLDVNRNSLSGPLPVLPPSLTYLNLARNQLSGGLGNLKVLPHLSFLDLSQNLLSGFFPVELLSAPLTSLSLQRNYLSGPLSPLQLVVIPTVDLSFNQLSGPISPFFAFARNLYLNNNRFTGGVPQEFIDQLLSSSMQTLFLQHNFLTNFPLGPGSSLPLTASVCVQYNCMLQLPPIDSPCPHNRGKRRFRPSTQCKST